MRPPPSEGKKQTAHVIAEVPRGKREKRRRQSSGADEEQTEEEIEREEAEEESEDAEEVETEEEDEVERDGFLHEPTQSQRKKADFIQAGGLGVFFQVCFDVCSI